MALLQSAYITRARALVFSPLRPVRNHRGASFSFSLRLALSALPFVLPAIAVLLAPDDVGICVQAYTLSSAFLTEADSGMHDGPKVSLNTPPPRESTPPRVYPRQSPRRNRSEPSGFRCRLLAVERSATVSRRKNLALDPSAHQACRIPSDMIAV